MCTNSWQKIWRSRYDFLFAALVSPGSVCRIHRPPTSKLHTIISCKGADALGTVRKQSHSLHVVVCQFDGYKKSIYRVKLFHFICVGGKCLVLMHCCMTILHQVSDKYAELHTYLRMLKGLDLAWCINRLVKKQFHSCQAVIKILSGSCHAIGSQ